MKRRALLVLILAVAITAFFIPGLFQGSAKAEPLYSQEVMGPSLDELAVKGILADHGSPLPWWTICAFAESHPDFSIAAYLAVMWCESSLGTTGGSARYNNPGNIKWGGWMDPDDSRVWYRWMNGSWYCPGQGTYGTYPSMYWGQRAAIRLIYDAGYNADLAAEDWWGFSNRYYGAGVPGISRYVANLEAAHKLIVKEAREYGTLW